MLKNYRNRYEAGNSEEKGFYKTSRTLYSEEQTASVQEQEALGKTGGEEPAFKLHSREAIEKRLEQLKQNPKLLDQGYSPTCSLATVAYVWMNIDFEGFRQTVLDLYEKGKATYNNYTIEPDDHLMKVDPNGSGYPYSPSRWKDNKSNYSADWIILSCLADNMNSFYDYDGEGYDEKGGEQTMDEYRGLAHKLFNKTHKVSDYVEYNHTSEADVKALFQKFETVSNAGGYVVMGVDVKLVENATQSEGGHAVTYIKGTLNFYQVNGKDFIEFRVQTWGKPNGQTVKVSLEDANKKFNRYFTVEKKNE